MKNKARSIAQRLVLPLCDSLVPDRMDWGCKRLVLPCLTLRYHNCLPLGTLIKVFVIASRLERGTLATFNDIWAAA